MDATTDKDPSVQEQIYNALCYLGEAEPEEILNCCDEYLRQHEKVGLCMPAQSRWQEGGTESAAAALAERCRLGWGNVTAGLGVLRRAQAW